VDEAVARAILVGDETIAFVDVEEFYGADGHGCFLSRKQKNPPAKAPGELIAREGKYPPVGKKIPSQATLARAWWIYFPRKSSFLTTMLVFPAFMPGDLAGSTARAAGPITGEFPLADSRSPAYMRPTS
jgi:hypothetical protein